MTKLISIVREIAYFLRQIFYSILRNNPSKIAAILRQRLLNTKCYIDTAVFITNPKNFEAMSSTALTHGCYIGNSLGRVSLGMNSHLGAYCYVNAVKGAVHIGNDVAIGPGTKIISYSNHFVPGQAIHDTKIVDDIRIKDHVFIGSNVTILPGTVIESNVVVGAGSIVKGQLLGNGLYAGAPCRRIRDLDSSAIKETANNNV